MEGAESDDSASDYGCDFAYYYVGVFDGVDCYGGGFGEWGFFVGHVVGQGDAEGGWPDAEFGESAVVGESEVTSVFAELRGAFAAVEAGSAGAYVFDGYSCSDFNAGGFRTFT